MKYSIGQGPRRDDIKILVNLYFLAILSFTTAILKMDKSTQHPFGKKVQKLCLKFQLIRGILCQCGSMGDSWADSTYNMLRTKRQVHNQNSFTHIEGQSQQKHTTKSAEI